VSTPSDRAPFGARGHRVLLTRTAAEAALPSLLGMALDFTASFDGHDARRKIGIITSVEISDCHPERAAFAREGSGRAESRRCAKGAHPNSSAAILVHGYIFARDFPDVVRELRASAHSLGMSYEIADVKVADTSAPIWELTEVTFTGAAVLRRDKAAYSQTSIELCDTGPPLVIPAFHAGRVPALSLSGEAMEPELIPTTERLAAAAEALAQAVARLDQQHQQLAEKIDRIVATVDDTAESARLALEARVAELERANSELKAQAARSAEPPLITSLLVKNGLDASTAIAPEVLDKTLAGLSVEQRIAVKAQMARAGLLE
jgi:hypothetical protein